MTPDEQEAGSIKYVCHYHFAILRSGNYALFSREAGRKPIFIGPFEEFCAQLALLEYAPYTPTKPEPKPKLTVDDLLKGLSL